MVIDSDGGDGHGHGHVVMMAMKSNGTVMLVFAMKNRSSDGHVMMVVDTLLVNKD